MDEELEHGETGMTCHDGHVCENGRCVECGDEMPPDHNLSPLHERSLIEVGEELGMSPQMVHIVEQRALAKLRRILATRRWWREELERRGD